MPYMVKEVADLAGVSVRTLHYYDQIALLKPDTTNQTGYRIYSDDDLDRLQQILFFKELDFSLAEIKDIIDSPDYDKRQTLKEHKKLLIKKKERLEKIINSVENTINSLEGGSEVDKNKMFDGFDMSDIEKHKEKYAEEAKEKYGHTAMYRESTKKSSEYTDEDWARITKEQNQIYQRLAGLMDRDPDTPEVQKAIEKWRKLITENLYECNLDIFRRLGDLYINDRRFTKNIDKFKPGLAQFMQEAIHVYCEKKEN